MKKLLLIIIVLNLSLFSQETNEDKTKLYNTAPNFYIDILNYPGSEEGKTKVDIFIQLPYANVQFIKTDEKFVGGYSVNLTVYDEDKDNIIDEKIWDETIVADNFNQTSSPNNYNLSLRTLHLTPEKYVLRCLVEDKHSNRSVTSEHTMEVLALTDSVNVSDILLVEEVLETESGKRIVPNISQSIKSMESIINFYYEVYSDNERDLQIEYNIVDKNENQSYTNTIDKHLNKGKNEIFGSLEYPNFTFGEYELLVKVKDSTNKYIAGIGKTFYAKVLGMPRSISDLEKAVDQMVYIATSSEQNHIEEAETFEETLNRFLTFWNEKDPTPNTKINEAMLEYFRRVEYANANFEAYKNEGWRTDMGMIYISLGPPDHVDRHPFEFDSKPYEVWDYYNINRRFVFVDYSGFGDYRLINRDYYDWNRYRY